MGAGGGQLMDALGHLRGGAPEVAQKHDLRQGRGAKGGGQAGGQLGGEHHGFRHTLDDAPVGGGAHEVGHAHPLAALHQQFGQSEGDHQRPVALGRQLVRGVGHGSGQVGPDPHRVGSLPFALAHIKMIVAGGTAPVHAGGGLAIHEAAILPEILPRAGPAAPVQTVLHVGRDAARLQHQPRHGGDQLGGVLGSLFDGAVGGIGHDVDRLTPAVR